MRIETRDPSSALRALALSLALLLGAAASGTLGLGSPSASAASAPRCQYSQLMAFSSSGGGAFDAAGSHAYAVLLANVSGTTCTLEGFPAVTLSGPDVTLKDVRVERNRSGIFQSEPPRRVSLGPGDDASFGISYSDGYVPASDTPRTCLATSATFLLPAAEKYKSAYRVAIDIDVCRSDRRIGVTPVEPGPVPQRPANT